jgi:hypothetical protein
LQSRFALLLLLLHNLVCAASVASAHVMAWLMDTKHSKPNIANT